MSHLSYFGGGGSVAAQKSANTFTTTMEATSQDIAREILEDIITILLDNVGVGEDTLVKGTSNQVVSDFIIDSNFENLRKKVFVKERVQPIARGATITKKPNSTFKNSKFVTQKAETAVEGGAS